MIRAVAVALRARAPGRAGTPRPRRPRGACRGPASRVDRDGGDPELAEVRKTRTAISPRLATSTFENGCTGGVFSRTVTLADQLTVLRAAAVPVVVLLYAWDFENHTTGPRRSSSSRWRTTRSMAGSRAAGHELSRSGSCSTRSRTRCSSRGLVMLIGEGAPPWMVALIVVREILVSGLRLAALERGVVLGARDLGRQDGGAGARRAIAGYAAAGAWSDDVAWWALLLALVATWISGSTTRESRRGCSGARGVAVLVRLAVDGLERGRTAPGAPVGRRLLLERLADLGAPVRARRAS